jgi:hypothetical protein
MANSYRFHERAERAERECTEYLKQLGWLIVPAANYANDGAPMVEAANRNNAIVMPDQIGMKNGRMASFDSKWKTKAVARRTHDDRLFTGIDRHSYLHYRRFERESGMPVVVVFLHENENEVRCGSLDRLDRNQAPHATAEQHGKGGMHNWWYESIPLWMSYTDMKLCIRDRILAPTEIPDECWFSLPRATPHHRPDPTQQSLFGDLGIPKRGMHG